MSLIWLGKPKGKDYGATLRQQCERCHNDVFYHLVQTQRWLSINFIPILPFSSRYRLECPICTHGRELAGEEIETQKRAALLTAAHAYATKREGDTIFPVRPSLATVPSSFTPEHQSQAEATENDAGGQKLRLRIVTVVVVALVAAAVVCVAIIAPKNAPTSSSSSSPSMQAIAPSTTAQTLLPRTPVRGNARRSKRTQSRTAASSSALPPARGEQ